MRSICSPGKSRSCLPSGRTYGKNAPPMPPLPSSPISTVCIGAVLPMFGTQAESLTIERNALRDEVLRLLDLKSKFEGRVDIQLALNDLGRLAGDDLVACMRCTALERDLAILHDGSAYPCPFVRNTQYRLGSVIDTSIEVLWNGDIANQFRTERDIRQTRHCLSRSSASAGLGDGSMRSVAEIRGQNLLMNGSSRDGK